MTPQRWGRIKEVFQAALTIDVAQRRQFVDNACRSDADVHREVLRLLNEHRDETQDGGNDSPGRTVSQYELIEKIGEGGMGVVYKARDTRLNRMVALKFIRPEALSTDEVRLRFLHEARAAAAIDHPNVCTVYEIGEADGEAFLAMAWVDGESLAEKVRRGPCSIEEALTIVSQVADGLHAAHELGIVHRDVKSSNVLITSKGQVKIADFGLARLAEETRITRAGAIMGTPAYMAPEQVRGEDVDHRTDIWSAGVLLYELLTGQLPFRAPNSRAAALTIQNEQHQPVTGIRAGVPIEVDFILDKALAKDPAERYHHALDLLVDLKTLSRRIAAKSLQPGQSLKASGRQVSREEVRRKHRRRLLQAGVACTALVFLVVFPLEFRRPAGSHPQSGLRKFSIECPGQIRADWGGRDVALSPDGKHVAMAAADGRLWVHDLTQWQARAIDGAQGTQAPFWSPDSQYIAYVAGNELMKVRASGGTPIRVCRLPQPRFHGGTWSPDGESIVFASSDELYAVPSAGGAAAILGVPKGSVSRKYYPWFIPAGPGRRVLAFSGGMGKLDLYLYDIGAGRVELLGPGCKPTWSQTGHVIYQPTEFVQELWALPTSLRTLQAQGKPFVIAQNALEPTASDDGTLAYRSPMPQKGGFTWVDRRGREMQTITLDGTSNLFRPALSPDGRVVAYLGRAGFGSEQDVWVYDLERGTNYRLTTDNDRDLGPAWSGSGEFVAFTSNRTGPYRIYLRRADGTGDTRSLTHSGNNFVTDWSRDGKYIFYEETAVDRFGDLWYLTHDRASDTWTPKPHLQSQHGDRFAELSPDGRYVAYLSNETGREELYVRTFPDPSRRWAISMGGAFQASWRSDGRELFYVSNGTLMAVPVSTTPDFSRGTPLALFPLTGTYDVSADGQRFLVSPPQEAVLEQRVRVVQNWYAEFAGRK